jgi:hypothetical protein
MKKGNGLTELSFSFCSGFRSLLLCRFQICLAHGAQAQRTILHHLLLAFVSNLFKTAISTILCLQRPPHYTLTSHFGYLMVSFMAWR